MRQATRGGQGPPAAAKSEIVLPADLRHVRTARRHLRDALTSAGLVHLADRAALAVSEVVTNAFVHTGTSVLLRVTMHAATVRVEVEDGGSQPPTRRTYAETAGTGRGLQLLEESVERWGTTELPHGKVVWFELGDIDPAIQASTHQETETPDAGAEVVRVVLRQVPLLMHVAWQEHAASLMREHLLLALATDEDALGDHARASAAMSLLHEQLPAPTLGDEPTALMAKAVEPHVTATELVVVIPTSAVPYFSTLNTLLTRAIAEARAGALLSPPTQPEIAEMRQWLCAEVARQAAGDRTAIPWVARIDVRATFAVPDAEAGRYAELADAEGAVLVSDEASVIVAASARALVLLGYTSSDELLGRRVLVVVPAQFHQAHIAGTTMNATNGRDNLLAVPIRVPMVRADATEVVVDMEVRPHLMSDGQRVFVAQFATADTP